MTMFTYIYNIIITNVKIHAYKYCFRLITPTYFNSPKGFLFYNSLHSSQ